MCDQLKNHALTRRPVETRLGVSLHLYLWYARLYPGWIEPRII
ncbi:hypothetical protein NIES2104_27200 [Leptolyngbya sp. NIES-2104]|nr:hypothetical protein NIES2104_27200 [Leptolyngbya sp. NIES-2104]